MTIKSIELKQKKIARALQTVVHPDNPLAVHMQTKYRELEQLKSQIK